MRYGWLLAGLGAVAAGGAYLLTRTRPAAGATLPATAVGATETAPPAAFQVALLSADQVAPGQYGTARLQVRNVGGQAGTVTVTGDTYLNGTRQGGWTMAQVTVGSGQAETITLRTAGPIAQQFAGQVLEIVFRTDTGQEVRGTLMVAAPAPQVVILPPAAFELRLIGISSPVNPGEFAQATLEVRNVGGQPGAVTIDGATLSGGVKQGSWM